MKSKFDLTDKMREKIIELSFTKTLKDIAVQLNIPYHVVVEVNSSIIESQLNDHRIHSSFMKSLGLDYVTSARERFERAPEVERNGMVYKIVRSDENEWIKND